jgi:cell wall-associated NlpC family hydrolase
VKAAQIVAIARELLGTRYAHQGRLSGVAVDCAGVPVHVWNRLGLPLAADHPVNYGRLPVPNEMRAQLDKHLVRVARADMQVGDVAWIKFQQEPQHLAIVGDYRYGGFSLIHSYNGSGLMEVVEHRLDETWAKRIVAVWRFPGVEA